MHVTFSIAQRQLIEARRAGAARAIGNVRVRLLLPEGSPPMASWGGSASAALLDDAVGDGAPLAATIGRFLDEAMLTEIAAACEAGRALLIGTTGSTAFRRISASAARSGALFTAAWGSSAVGGWAAWLSVRQAVPRALRRRVAGPCPRACCAAAARAHRRRPGCAAVRR